MKKFLLGFLIGVAALLVFLYLGGSRYVKLAGQKTMEAGDKLEGYEKQLKKTTKDAKKKVTGTLDATKEKVEETTDKVKKLIP